MARKYTGYELTGEGKYLMARCEWEREMRILKQLAREYEVSMECWKDACLPVVADEHYQDCEEIICDIRLCQERIDHWNTMLMIYAPIPF